MHGRAAEEKQVSDPFHIIESPAWPGELLSNEIYERRGDMSPDGMIRVIVQGDGDVCLTVIDTDDFTVCASVEFCTRVGGGKSSRVRQALLILAEAIRRDNVERPQFRK